ncbi:glycosyl transferase family 1 [Shimia isoporae]|uniref:Glycosyl transferase family 1 n=1 Tax=Shimia isoporae TaxID=647720 RepID=A0A4R1NMQ6_9RHOB|nr:glycosyltransferase family 4 protein [Shimia isoporae]TCL09049.1 glycosyl transferase family 1 [Shimia isoporae]
MIQATLNTILNILRDQRTSAATGLKKSDVSKVLDSDFYQRTNPDAAAAAVPMDQHFRRHGISEERKPSAFFTADYVRNHLIDRSFRDETALDAYVRSGMFEKPRLLFVSHDASRTGAPAIILRLLDMISKTGAFECFTILDAGGERLPEFQALSHCHVMSRSRHAPDGTEEQAIHEIRSLFGKTGIFRGNPPVCALVNSAESHRIGRALAAQSVPVISLIHEIAAYYPPARFEEIANYSHTVVFPSQFVSRAAETYSELDMKKTTVRGQGLLQDDFGSMEKSTCRRLLRERLNLPEDAFVVLNVGTVDIRKGSDMFVDIAALALEMAPQGKPLHFVWHGAPDKSFTYAQDAVIAAELEQNIHFLPSTPDIEQVFLGGDLFLLTARADPFPCVIHEAMACGLPVIAFRNGGGAPELIGDDAGTIVDMGDLAAAARAVDTYLINPALTVDQGTAAKQKIAANWDYASYCMDVYGLIKSAAKRQPVAGWPELQFQTAPEHLIVMNGCREDLRALMALGGPPEQCDVVLIDGRFGADVDEVLAELNAKNFRVKLCQPPEDTRDARALFLRDLLANPRPKRLTMINTLELLSLTQLTPLTIPKQAVLTGNSLSTTYLGKRIGHLEALHLSDPDLQAALTTHTHGARDVVRPLQVSP